MIQLHLGPQEYIFLTIKNCTGVSKHHGGESGNTRGCGTGWQGLAVLITITYKNTASITSLQGVVNERKEMNESFCDPFLRPFGMMLCKYIHLKKS